MKEKCSFRGLGLWGKGSSKTTMALRYETIEFIFNLVKPFYFLSTLGAGVFCWDSFERMNLILFRDGFYVVYGSSRHTMWAAMMPNQPQKQSSIVRNKGITWIHLQNNKHAKNNILMQPRERKINRNLKSWYFDDHLLKILYQKRLSEPSRRWSPFRAISTAHDCSWVGMKNENRCFNIVIELSAMLCN